MYNEDLFYLFPYDSGTIMIHVKCTQFIGHWIRHLSNTFEYQFEEIFACHILKTKTKESVH